MYDGAFFIEMNNKPPIFLIVCLIIVSAVFSISISTVKAEEVEIFEQQKLTSHLLINLFLEKLDQNELLIFHHALNKHDLQAHQVSYVHNITDDSLLVRLCFKLKKVILVPEFEEFYVNGITVETDQYGNIIQIKTQVSAMDKKGTKKQNELR